MAVMRKPTSKPARQKKIQTVELDWYADDETVTVTPRNQRRFQIQKGRAIEILQVAEDRRRRFEEQFDLLLQVLAQWIRQHASEIETGYLTLQDASFLFVAVRNRARVDLEFEDALSELDFEIANDPDLDLIRLHTLSLPPVGDQALRAFVHDSFLYSYHAHRE